MEATIGPIQEIEKLATELEADIENEEINENRDSRYLELAERAKQTGAAELAERLRFDALAMGYPELTRKIPAEALQHYEKRLQGATNPIYRAAFGRILWDFKYGDKPYKNALIAIEGLLDSAAIYRARKWFIPLMEALPEALVLAATLRQGPLSDKAKSEMIDAVREFDRTQNYRWIIEHLEALFSTNSIEFSEAEAGEIEQIIQRGISYYEGEQGWETDTEQKKRSPDRYMQRAMNALLISLYSKQKDADSALKSRKEAALRLEKAGDEADPIARPEFHRKAAEAFQELGMTEDLDRIKIKLKQTGADAVASMKAYSGSVRIEREKVEEFVSIIVNDDLENALTNFAFSNMLIPNVEVNKKLAEEFSKEFIFASLVRPVVLRNNNIVATPTTRDEVERYRFVEQYNFAMQNIAVVYLNTIFERLVEKYQLDAEKLVDFLKGGVIDDDKLEILKVGFQRFFEGDYVSAIHILTPHLEDTLRRIIGKLNLPTTALRAGITFHEISLEQVLDTLGQQQAFQPDIIEYLKVFLTEQTSDNLRNRVGHGLVSFEECNQRRATILVHMFIILRRFALSSTTDKSSGQSAPLQNTIPKDQLNS